MAVFLYAKAIENKVKSTIGNKVESKNENKAESKIENEAESTIENDQKGKDPGDDLQTAYKYYKMAAEKGIREAMHMLEIGEYGIQVKIEEACKYYKIAADKESKEAL